LSDALNQTWILAYEGKLGQEAKYSEEVGISVGGMNQEAKAAIIRLDNSIMRVLTLRECDEPQAVANWWYGDEKMRLVHAEGVENEKKEAGSLRVLRMIKRRVGGMEVEGVKRSVG